jgi:hypothetical protein
MDKKQNFVAYLKDEAGNMVTFERFSCMKAETAKKQLLEVFTRSSLYRVSVKPATRAEVYATPDGYNTDPAPVLVFDLKENEQKPNKAEFINAYIYSYGTTKKQAEKAYKEASAAYIAAIIDSYHQDARKAFYND